MTRSRAFRILRVPALLFALSAASGCDMAYLFHAASGQIRLVWNAVPVQVVLDSQVIQRPRKEKLLLIQKIKAFGEKHLGISHTDNYTTINLQTSRSPIYTVSAAPRDCLVPHTWWFPLVGHMPYLGFFDRGKAIQEARRLSRQGLDVFVGSASAYSTLGWFKDPVTPNLLDKGPAALANTILHELTHATLYVKGRSEFNESLAVLVGLEGALRFLRETFGPSHPWTRNAEDALHDERLFSTFLRKLFDELEALYAGHLPKTLKLEKRQLLFTRAKEDFSRLKARLRTDGFSYFETMELNNASLLAVGLYHRRFGLMQEVLRAHGGDLRAALEFFRGISEARDDPLAGARLWLERGGIAHRRP